MNITSLPQLAFFNVEQISYGLYSLTISDLSGRYKLRHLWYHYFYSCIVIIYVVDSSDVERMDEARKELHKLMSNDDKLRNAKFLIYANKQDLPYALSALEVAERLDLSNYKRNWHVQPCCRTSTSWKGYMMV